MNKIILFFFSLLISQTNYGQNLKQVIDSIAKIHLSNTENFGLAIGIIEKGNISQNYFGGKYTNQIIDIDNTTLFEIGSITKLYTSFILASLELENKLNRNDLLSQYLPERIREGKKWESEIRLVDLATHTSGLPSFDNTESLKTFQGFDVNNPYGLFTESFMLSLLKNTDTHSNYGKINYSNFGFGLLGYAMSYSQNTNFETLFNKYITEGQNLNSTFLCVGEDKLTEIAIPHRGNTVMPLIQLAELKPSGSIKTTLPDLLNFLGLHLRKPENVKDIIEILFENQLKGKDQALGLGWGIHQIRNETVYFHTGGTYGSSSIVIVVPSKNSALAILANNKLEDQLTNYALKIVDELIKSN